MKKHNTILCLALIIFFLFSNISYAAEDKTILILLDEMNFQDIQSIFNDENLCMGFVNLKTRKPYEKESFYFSIATGRKVGVDSHFYKGLYKNRDGSINIMGFDDMFQSIKKYSNNIRVDLLGEKLKDKGISYIGERSSAIVAADKNGNIKSGEVEINYEEEWLKDKTKEHLSNSNVLVLSYNVEDTKNRIELLTKYIDEFKDNNIIILPSKASDDMKYILNKNLAPIIYINGNSNGILKSSSTKREGFVTLEDVSTELLSLNGEKGSLAIGNRFNVIEKDNNINNAKSLFKRTINLFWITYIFHGIVYFIQIYSAYFIYKNRKDKYPNIHIYYSFIIINIFVSLLMGISSLHINLVLYLAVNILTTYIITLFITDKEVSTVGLFATLTYGLIVFGIFFYPKLIYNSYIGFNNLIYGARYYGFNNGIMGVLLVSSIISYFFIKDKMPNDIVDNIVCLLYFSVNMVVLSGNYGANTGGFITSVVLFLVMIYINLLNKNGNIKNIVILTLVGVSLFAINMYFDSLSNEKSHAINFLYRIKTFGVSEFLDIFKIKIRELVKLTLLPPFSIVIISQIISLKTLLKRNCKDLKKQIYVIIFISLVGFMLNDTGMITFIYMIHYLISLLVYVDIENPYNI